MKKTEKEALVTGLRDRMKGASSLYYTDFTGLNVKQMTDLRRRLRKAGVEYVVIKNSLAQRAVAVMGSYVGNLRELKAVVALAKKGKLKPTPLSTRPADEVNAILEELKAGKVLGRVVLDLEHASA